MPFLKRVKPLWDRSPLTLAELADLCNISESSASRYMSGKISPPADVAERIIEVLGGGVTEDEDAAPEVSPAAESLVQHIREIYQAQIAALHATFDRQLATIQRNYESQIASLQKEKLILFCTVIVLLGLLVYFILDGLHGNWGIIRYAMAEVGGL